jgi:hypothetical protein
MKNDCNPEALEALVTGAPTSEPIDRDALEAHAERCEDCKHELRWLRAERGLFAASAESQPPVERLWPAIAAKLPPTATAATTATASPYRTASPPPVQRAAARWSPIAIAAASVTALVALSSFAAYQSLRRDPSRFGRALAGMQTTHDPVTMLPAPGPVSIRVGTSSTDVRIEPGLPDRIRVNAGSGGQPGPSRGPDGRYELLLDESIAAERLVVELPPGSAVEVVTASGAIAIGALAGPTRVQTSSGDVEVQSATNAAITTASGDVDLRSATGTVAIRTVSGDVRVRHSGSATDVRLHSTSGSLTWQGRCALGCRLNGESVSGDIELTFVGESGAIVRYSTRSGSLDDRVESVESPAMNGVARRFASGEGSIDVVTTSGSLALVRAR